MAKSTFRRMAQISAKSVAISMFMMIGALTFFVGSILFWPHLLGPEHENVEWCETWGSILFLSGSIIYTVGMALHCILDNHDSNNTPPCHLFTLNHKMSDTSHRRARGAA